MFGTASTAKQDFVADLGVTPIDYRTEDFVEKVMAATENKGVDVVFDAVSIDTVPNTLLTLPTTCVGALVIIRILLA